MRIDVPHGDVVDRIVILELKVARLTDPARRADAEAHLAVLRATWDADGPVRFEDLEGLDRLRAVNATLWDVEDALRVHERDGRFDGAFVELARSVYRLNDERARLKASVDRATGSRYREPKSYA